MAVSVLIAVFKSDYLIVVDRFAIVLVERVLAEPIR